MNLNDMRRNRDLLLILVPATVVPALLWLSGSGFGENLLVEVLGVWLTVFAIDAVIRAADERSKRPLREAMTNEAFAIQLELGFFIEIMLRLALEAEDEKIDAAVEANDPARFEAWIGRLKPDLPAVVGKEGRVTFTVENIVAQHLMPVLDNTDRFIKRYVSIADPQLIADLQKLEANLFFQMVKLFNVRMATDRFLAMSWPSLCQSWKDITPQVEAALRASMKPDRRVFVLDLRKIRTEATAADSV